MTAEQKTEWEAWQAIVKAWPGDINQPQNDAAVKAIREWGKTLGASPDRTVFTLSLKDRKQELHLSGDLSALTTVLVIGPGYYGYGESLKVARANCIKSGAKSTDKMLAYLGDDSIGVTDFGEIRADKALVCLGVI